MVAREVVRDMVEVGRGRAVRETVEVVKVATREQEVSMAVPGQMVERVALRDRAVTRAHEAVAHEAVARAQEAVARAQEMLVMVEVG